MTRKIQTEQVESFLSKNCHGNCYPMNFCDITINSKCFFLFRSKYALKMGNIKSE